MGSSAHITRLIRGSECIGAGNKHVIDVLENFFKLNRHHHSDSVSSLVAARAPKFGSTIGPRAAGFQNGNFKPGQRTHRAQQATARSVGEGLGANGAADQ